MALVLDTGVIYAAIDRSDQDHSACRDLLTSMSEPLVVPSPVLVEVDYWIHQRLTVETMLYLLDDIASGSLSVVDLTPADYRRVHALCEQYRDADIGFVDAAVLAVVERLNEPKLATLDHRHFRMVRPRHAVALELLPELR